MPLYRDPRSDFLVTQYSMKYVEQAGLVKFDFLGLTTLTILQRAVGFLDRLGVRVDIDRLPFDDAATWEMLQRGDAAGVFQCESAGMRDVLRQMRPDRFEDLIAAVALYRPGPMANIPAYCQRKHGEKWEPPHPDLQEILAETYGIMVYQEQVMQIAQKMAGYSLGAADLLRRAMGKKIRSEMEAQRRIFTEGATARGIAPEKAGEIFDLMAKFADYGFNKSHAAAYALVAWQTAWMKANHPVAFIAACMSLALGNTDKLAALRQEAARMGIRGAAARHQPFGRRFSARADGGWPAGDPLCAGGGQEGWPCRDAGGGAGARRFARLRISAISAARVDPGPLNRMALENLVRAGAFDGLEPNRAKLYRGHRDDSAARAGDGGGEDQRPGRRCSAATEPEPVKLPDTPDWPPMERLAFEAEAVGFHLTAHPLDVYAGSLRRLGVIASNQIAARAEAGSARIKLAGAVVASKERITRTGSRMAWLRLSDGVGGFEVTVFSEVLSRSRDLIVAGAMLLVTADIRMEGESLRITAQEILPLDQAVAGAGAGMRVWLQQTEAVAHIRTILGREGRGRGRVVLVPRVGGTQDVEITLPGRFNVTPRLAQALKLVPGVQRVEEIEQ